MSVDGIGKGGGAPEIGGTGEATSVSDAESVEPATEGVSSEFSLEAAASAQGPNDVAAASDLQRLEQGQITLEQYLDCMRIDADPTPEEIEQVIERAAESAGVPALAAPKDDTKAGPPAVAGTPAP